MNVLTGVSGHGTAPNDSWGPRGVSIITKRVFVQDHEASAVENGLEQPVLRASFSLRGDRFPALRTGRIRRHWLPGTAVHRARAA